MSGVKGLRPLRGARSAPLTPDIRGASESSSPVQRARRAQSLVLVLLLSLAFEAESSSSETLAKIRAAYATAGSVSCTFVQTYAPAGFSETAPETGKLVLQAPDRVRFDYDGPEGKVFTFDGTAARQYVAADRQMVVKRLAPGDRERLPLVFLESTDALLARFDASEKPAENGLVEVTLVPKRPLALKSVALLVLPASGEVKRLVLLDAAGNRTAFTFTQKMSGRKRPDADFALAPPEGTKILTE